MANRELCICTWLYAESETDESTYYQVPGNPSSVAFQEVYWRSIALFFASSYRHQPAARHLLFTNVTAAPVVDGVDITSFLTRLGVETVVLPLTFVTPPDYFTAWRNQFYVFDIAHYLSRALKATDSAIVLDSDCVWISSAAPMHDALQRDGTLTYVENRPPDVPENGLTREEMRQIASSLLSRDVPHPLIYCGGELLAATGAEFARLADEIDIAWSQLMERHSSGQPTFNEEGHTLSYIYYKLGYPLGNGAPFIRRIWTGSLGSYNTALPHDHGLVVWHVPTEKRLGIRRLFPVVVDPHSVFWSVTAGRELRTFLGASLGVHRNSIRKRLLDFARRVDDRIRYR